MSSGPFTIRWGHAREALTATRRYTIWPAFYVLHRAMNDPWWVSCMVVNSTILPNSDDYQRLPLGRNFLRIVIRHSFGFDESLHRRMEQHLDASPVFNPVLGRLYDEACTSRQSSAWSEICRLYPVAWCQACHSVVDRSNLVPFFGSETAGIDIECYAYLREQCAYQHDPIPSLLLTLPASGGVSLLADDCFLDRAERERVKMHEALKLWDRVRTPSARYIWPLPSCCALCGNMVPLGTNFAVIGHDRSLPNVFHTGMYSLICEFCRSRLLAARPPASFRVLGWSFILYVPDPPEFVMNRVFWRAIRRVGLPSVYVALDWSDPTSRFHDVISEAVDVEHLHACIRVLDMSFPVSGRYRSLRPLRGRISDYARCVRFYRYGFPAAFSDEVQRSWLSNWETHDLLYDLPDPEFRGHLLFMCVPALRTQYGLLSLPLEQLPAKREVGQF